MRSGELQRMHNGIPAKTLSKELKDLEQNGLVKRTVLDTMPVTVTYEITSYGRTLEGLLNGLRIWGSNHREYIRTGNVPKQVAKARGEDRQIGGGGVNLLLRIGFPRGRDRPFDHRLQHLKVDLGQVFTER